MPVTRKPSYAEAVRWIAFNDNAGNGDSVYDVQGYVSTCLVADLFGVDQEKVGMDAFLARNGVGRYRIIARSTP